MRPLDYMVGTTATVHTLFDGHYFVQFSVNRPQFEVIE